jgi:glycosyltransferase involved in cell wall biosynthesis
VRIGISTSVIQRGKTGVAQYVFALARAFLPYTGQHQFTLFVLEEDLALFDFAKDKMKLVPVSERYRPPIKNIVWHQSELAKLVSEHGLDVLHVPSYRRMLWPKPCARVSTIHDLAPFRVANKYDWKRMIYGRVIARRLARRQDEIIAISENTARDIRAFFQVPYERITVIHNGLEHERFFAQNGTGTKEEISRRYGLERPFFLYTARLEHPGKNHVRLIKAFDEFKASTRSDWQLALAGSDWHGAEAIHAAIAGSPVKKDIRPLGFVPDADLPGLYRSAKVFVYPSLYEGFGMPPLEAMACGCPVISSARGSLGEVLGEAAAMVDPEDEREMANKLVALAESDAVRARLREAGLQQARKFDWARTASETLNIYARAAAAKTKLP